MKSAIEMEKKEVCFRMKSMKRNKVATVNDVKNVLFRCDIPKYTTTSLFDGTRQAE